MEFKRIPEWFFVVVAFCLAGTTAWAIVMFIIANVK